VTLQIGSLFAGIGGLELGLEMGLGTARTLWQVERDPYAGAVLTKHWPEAARYDDIRTLDGTTLPRIDLLCGGFPCQPHSVAGKRGGSNDERDLWPDFARIVRETRPRWVVAENVPGLLSNKDTAHGREHKGAFFGRVLADLAALGFDAEWHCFPAAAIGTHHIRERVFILAHAPQLLGHGGEHHSEHRSGTAPESGNGGGAQDVAHAHGTGRYGGRITDCP